MLEDLTIKDFALIDSVSIEFPRGFTVLSGETGAGKSILITSRLLRLSRTEDRAFTHRHAGLWRGRDSQDTADFFDPSLSDHCNLAGCSTRDSVGNVLSPILVRSPFRFRIS